MKFRHYLSILAASWLIIVAGCDGSSSRRAATPAPMDVPDPTRSYRFELTNLSYNQPLSPLALIVHADSFRGWTLGGTASDALELLAESGDNSAMLDQSGDVFTQGGTGIIAPGASEVLEAELNETDEMVFTLATMLVNTNDAFTGITGEQIRGMAAGESRSILLPVYDAGTEGNLELSGTIPGPADGGQGYSEDRDDVDYVAMHPGVVGHADGYTNSVLDESHRFDAPIALITVTRTE